MREGAFESYPLHQYFLPFPGLLELRYCGEMSELAEGARLEIACATKKWHRGFESLSLRHFVGCSLRSSIPVT